MIGIPVGTIGVCIFAFGNISLLILVMIGGWIALRDFWRMTGVRNTDALFSLPRFGELAILLLLYLAWSRPSGSYDVVLAVFIPTLFIVQLFAHMRGERSYLHEVAVVALGILYIGGLLSFLVRLRHLQIMFVDSGAVSFSDGFFKNPEMIHLTVFPVLLSWCFDTAAYFCGKYFGLGKLAPTISPKKTIIGLVGGIIGSVCGVILYAWVIGLVGQVPWWALILFGAVGGAISQLGDLSVSAMKREAQMKDSGRIMGAHGGMLDRIDGFLFAIPVTYVFFLIVLA